MEGYIGEVRLFAANFAPKNWAFCHGQLIAITQNQALFSLIGTIYGGDGRTTFALPNTQSRVVISAGQGPGLQDYRIGQTGGSETVTLTVNQIPSHTHGLVNNLTALAREKVLNDSATTEEPESNYFAQYAGGDIYSTSPDATMAPAAGALTGALTTLDSGGSQAHTNIQPVEALHYIICLYGIFPSRS